MQLYRKSEPCTHFTIVHRILPSTTALYSELEVSCHLGQVLFTTYFARIRYVTLRCARWGSIIPKEHPVQVLLHRPKLKKKWAAKNKWTTELRTDSCQITGTQWGQPRFIPCSLLKSHHRPGANACPSLEYIFVDVLANSPAGYELEVTINTADVSISCEPCDEDYYKAEDGAE